MYNDEAGMLHQKKAFFEQFGIYLIGKRVKWEDFELRNEDLITSKTF